MYTDFVAIKGHYLVKDVLLLFLSYILKVCSSSRLYQSISVAAHLLLFKFCLKFT